MLTLLSLRLTVGPFHLLNLSANSSRTQGEWLWNSLLRGIKAHTTHSLYRILLKGIFTKQYPEVSGRNWTQFDKNSKYIIRLERFWSWSYFGTKAKAHNLSKVQIENKKSNQQELNVQNDSVGTFPAVTHLQYNMKEFYMCTVFITSIPSEGMLYNDFTLAWFLLESFNRSGTRYPSSYSSIFRCQSLHLKSLLWPTVQTLLPAHFIHQVGRALKRHFLWRLK